ncbi:MAG: alpha/beta hydrolase [Erysipelotrichaceae bacterium]|nr:alpha/beta hydrolase [Erysipelotrichaceae bacterium]
MSTIQIKGLNIYYEVKGNKKQSVILLHGWGQNTTMMQAIQEGLHPYFTVYNLDFPGFGKSDALQQAWSTIDYTDFLAKFIKALNIQNPILIGHSFGCRIALRYASQYPVYKMILTGAAGLKPKRGFDYYVKVTTYKLLKQIFKLPFLTKYKESMQSKFGSTDYKNASPILRETLVKVVNEDIKPLLKDIQAETLLVFGSHDQATPLWMGKVMEKTMPNATLIVFEQDDHYAYFHQAQRFNLVLEAFLKEDIHD